MDILRKGVVLSLLPHREYAKKRGRERRFFMRLGTKLRTAFIVSAVGAFILSYYGLILLALLVDAHMPRLSRHH